MISWGDYLGIRAERMCGPNFRDYHRLLDEQGDQLFGMTDPIAERARKLGAVALHSIGEISRKQRLNANDEAKLSLLALHPIRCVNCWRRYYGFSKTNKASP